MMEGGGWEKEGKRRRRERVAVVAMVTSEQFVDLTNDDRRLFHRLLQLQQQGVNVGSDDEEGVGGKGKARAFGKGIVKEKEKEREEEKEGRDVDEVALVPVIVVWDRKDGRKEDRYAEEDEAECSDVNFFQELEQKVRSVYEDRRRPSASPMNSSEIEIQVLVVTRTPWDYTQRYPRWQHFLRHARSFTKLTFFPSASSASSSSNSSEALTTTPDAQTMIVECPVQFFNDIPTLEWNGHKQYLIDLSRSSDAIPVVPTRLIRKGSDLSQAIAQVRKQNSWHMHAEFVIIKPAVGSFGNDVNLIKLGSASKQDTKTLKHLEGLASQQDILVQPFLASVKTRGEVSLVFIDGSFVHAIKKKPSAGDFKVQGGKVDRHEPTEEELDLGMRTLQACLRIDSVHCEWESTDDSWLETTNEGEADVSIEEGDVQTGSSQAGRKAKATEGGVRAAGSSTKKTKQQNKQPSYEEGRIERKAKSSGSNKPTRGNATKKKESSGRASYLYARVDLLSTNRGKLMVSEVELLDPELFFRFSPECVEAFRRALLHRAVEGSSQYEG